MGRVSPRVSTYVNCVVRKLPPALRKARVSVRVTRAQCHIGLFQPFLRRSAVPLILRMSVDSCSAVACRRLGYC